MTAPATCHYCGREVFRPGSPEQKANRHVTRTLDHMRPFCAGGKDRAENRVICCAGCNSMKADAPYDVFLFYVRATPQEERTRAGFRLFLHDVALAGFRAVYAVTTRDKRMTLAVEKASRPKAPRRALEENKAYALHRASKRRQRAIMFDKRA